MKVAGLALATLALLACAPNEPKAPRELDAADASLAPASVDAALADVTVVDAPSPAIDAGLPDAKRPLPPGMHGSTVSCTTDDDCWSRGPIPIARPKTLRGKHFKPCVDGEYAPLCGGEGTCLTLGYRC